MASYVTLQEFDRLAFARDAIDGLENADILAALEAQSRVADGYLNKRFKLPLVSYSDDLKIAVVRLAVFELVTRRGFRPGSGNADILVDARDTAVAWLENVARGLVEPVVVDSTPELDEDGPLATSSPTPSFRFFTGPVPGSGGCCDD